MSILITGGAGFIGSHLAHNLQNKGHHITIIDNFRSGHKTNINTSGINVIDGDIRDFEQIHSAMNGTSTVFHLAALVSVPESVQKPALNHDINVTGTLNVLEAARQQNVQRVVYASSAAIYGNHPELPKTENSPVDTISPYAAAKYMNEIYAEAYAKSYGITTVGLRFMNVYGPRQDPSSPYSGVLSIVCQNARQGKPITIFGDGTQTRDFVFVEDVAQAGILAAMVDLPTKSEVFNIGTGKATSLNQIIDVLDQHTDIPIQVDYAPPREGDIKHSYANIDKAKQQLGYQPKTSIADGLAQTLAWFNEQDT